MMGQSRLTTELLTDLKCVMEQLMSLDIEDEGNMLVLHRLQVEQLEICEKLVLYKESAKSQETER